MSGEALTSERVLTQAELDELAFMEATEFALRLEKMEEIMSKDNYGGTLLHASIAFGD